MNIIRQIWRGCGTLPVVGEHPGTVWVVVFVLMGAFVGGWHGAVIAAVNLPLYLHGAYERAVYSDRILRREETAKRHENLNKTGT